MPRRKMVHVLVAGVLTIGLFTSLPSVSAAKVAGANGGVAVPAASPLAELGRLLQKDFHSLDKLMPRGDELVDAQARQRLAPKVLPLLTDIESKIVKFMHTATGLTPDDKSQVLGLQQHFSAVMAVLGDVGAQSLLKQETASADHVVKLGGQLQLLQVQWWQSAQNAGVQGHILKRMALLAKANPTDDTVTMMLLGMIELGSADVAVRDQARQIIMDDQFGPLAMQVKSDVGYTLKLHKKFLNKPVIVQGVLLGGGKFSTTQWKGKVVVVDFWATWCGPCRASLPGLERLYSKYHDQGLRVVGVSNDNSGAALKAFLKANPKMAWPQLFDESNPGWSLISTSFGLNSIPTQFIIDRQGILRDISVGFDPNHDIDSAVVRLLKHK
ncbi:MAG: redoxin domain-containing protein [Phycisphaerales bacterium]|nr:redoxin domain-containing protein [Phycisphaerales bacterium]